MLSRHILKSFLALGTIVAVSAWSTPTHQSSSQYYIRRSDYLCLAKQSDSDLIKDETGDESDSPSFGVSYIGGDPCGSKYNNDPFDATKEDAFKPGFPDDMKARIAALAAKKLEEEKNE